MIKSKDAFFAAIPKRSIKERLPDSDEEIELFELSISDRDEYIKLSNDKECSGDYRAAFVIARSCSFLTDDDIPVIQQKLSPTVIGLFSLRVLGMSAMLPKAVEDAVKNLESGLSSVSSTS